MENNKCGCGCEDTEYVDEPVKNNPKVSKENKSKDDECGCGDEDNANGPEENNESDCGCVDTKDNSDLAEEDDGCGCGCGTTEYPDESLIDNPYKPEFIADDNFIREFENYAHLIGFKSIGYTQLTPELLIRDKFMQYTNAIVLTMEMGKEIIETAPGAEAQRLNDLAYEKLGKMTYKLSDYLRENGYATEIAHPYDGIVNFTPLAQKAGLGWIGKSGLLITPEVGPGQKISAIFVSIANLPVKEDNEYTWIPEYCEKCGKCIKACPEKALVEIESCCGGAEIEFIQEQCIGCSQGCTYCIESCPFGSKGYEHVKNKFDKMNAKLMEKNKNKCC